MTNTHRWRDQTSLRELAERIASEAFDAADRWKEAEDMDPDPGAGVLRVTIELKQGMR